MPQLRRTAAALALALLAGPAVARQELPVRRGPMASPALERSSSLEQPHLTYCGGRVLSQAQIVAVLWGTPDTPSGSASCSGTMQSCLTRWFDAFVQSPQFDWLDEYQTTIPGADGHQTNQHIAAPTFYGVVPITPSNKGAVVGESAVQSEIISQIQAGNLPAPVADSAFAGSTLTIYEVFFPLSVDPSDPGRQACSAFCAYHDSWHSNVENKNMVIAILPSGMPPGYSGGRDCGAGCGEKTDWFANLGGSISHETIEAITDPDVGLAFGGCAAPLGWYDQSGKDAMSYHGEIGDECEDIPDVSPRSQITEVTLQDSGGHDYTVQREWSNQYSACMVQVDTGFHVTGPSGALITGADGTGTATFTTSAAEGGGALPITFAAHGVPGGITLAFNPQTVNAGESTTATLTIGASATQTGGAIGITAESGTTQVQTTLPFSAPDFSATLSGSSVSLTAGGDPASLELDTLILSGDPRDFTAALINVPGVTVTPSQSALGTASTLTFSAAAGTPSLQGTVQLVITSASIQHVLPLSIDISGDDASLTFPSMLTVAQGGSVSFPLATSTTHGNAQPLALSATDLPDGAAATFTPATLTSGESGMVALSVPGGEPLGVLTFHVSAKGPAKNYLTAVSVQVVAPSGCSAAPAGWLLLTGLAALGLRRRARAK